MSKSIYSVLVIFRGRQNDYRLFWNEGRNVNGEGVELKSDELSFPVTVEARNEAEAIRMVQKMHPDDIVSREGTERIGKA
ncbi:hypothetical protein [Ramlibacter sp. WS9]|uniref:hypothetical protein n=1 Tax=Ramlibacter sp. WS9 TaxID=1882741 RepID=UPI0011412D20|nr:hypothetical protein [Ramlibacter sp. WS9]ROZ72086.1 hypothetical protein EEB15_20115 [Ramlibacter sp. WS9]